MITECTGCWCGVSNTPLMGNPASPAYCCSTVVSASAQVKETVKTGNVGFQETFNKSLQLKIINHNLNKQSCCEFGRKILL